MSWIRSLILNLLLMVVIGACLKQPEHSIIPQIQFQSLAFKNEYLSTGKNDTLIITLKFTDGDGDLGVNPDETAIYTSYTDSIDISTPFYYVYDSTSQLCGYPICETHTNNYTLPAHAHYINYQMKRTVHAHPFDTLPDLACKYWEYRYTPADTLYIQNNPYHNNIFASLYFKDLSTNTYTYFDIDTYFGSFSKCTTNFLNARFPILSTDLGKKSPLDGTLTYKYDSPALYFLLKGNTIKIRAYILDRAMHKSNVAESDDLVIR